MTNGQLRHRPGQAFGRLCRLNVLTDRLLCSQEEIEKVKKRRLDREKERAEQDEMLTMLQRDRGQAEAIELEKKEEVFHLEQAKARAKQRIREGRSALLANRRAHVSKPLCTSQQTMTSTSCHVIQCVQCICIQMLWQLRKPKTGGRATLSKPGHQVCQGLNIICSLLLRLV